MKVPVSRKKWVRGKLALRSGEVTMISARGCCIFGFVGLANGASEEDLWEKTSPLWAPQAFHLLGFLEDQNFMDSVMSINDSEHISDAEREERLTELFLRYDIHLEFQA